MNILRVLTPKRVTGNFGERAAASYLRKNGYKILEKNFVGLGNEIDIIAKSRDTLAFVEVKTRNISSAPEFESRPAASVTKEKQRKIIKQKRGSISRPSKYNSDVSNLPSNLLP